MYPAGGSSLHFNNEVPSDATTSLTISYRIFRSRMSPNSVRKWPEKRASSCLWTVKEPALGPYDLLVMSSLTRIRTVSCPRCLDLCQSCQVNVHAILTMAMWGTIHCRAHTVQRWSVLEAA